jgi:alpha-amylase/alpha-mannosidase (GH57 family)
VPLDGLYWGANLMGHVELAFLWHFHQPCYRDLATGRILMPWVRLHGLKDYTGMAALLAEFPGIRCTANFSPVLLDQIEAYESGARDGMLDLSMLPAAELDEEQESVILDTFFRANPQSVIGTQPRYRELMERRRAGRPFSEEEFRDLQVLANLAWIHPLEEGALELRRKGRGYTEADKLKMNASMREILARIRPRWSALHPRVEMSVSPYYHPIVPLLCDVASAREAIPQLPLPDVPSMKEDAEAQVREALRAGERHFGRRPEGIWPSEGSVSLEACAIFRKAGARWVATDEALLGRPGVRTLDGLKIAFRDTDLSNRIGFTYKTMPAEEAAEDFVRRAAEHEGPLPVILDGENPWEHYPDGGVAFLRALFRRLSDHPRIRTVTMSELSSQGEIRSLRAGSWINANFGIWIGHPEDRRGWELLGRAVRDLQGTESPLARECLWAAQGSDWFWWFGEDFSSDQDAEFDALFRRHLGNAYQAAGKVRPEDLMRPVKRSRKVAEAKRPWGPLKVRLDGRCSDFFEWVSAGRYDMALEFSALAGQAVFLSEIHFGFDLERLLIRLDFRKGLDPQAALAGGRIRVVVTAPREVSAPLDGVIDRIFEAAVPFESLGLQPGEEVEFHLRYEGPEGTAFRVPMLASLSLQVPGSDYETVHWRV